MALGLRNRVDACSCEFMISASFMSPEHIPDYHRGALWQARKNLVGRLTRKSEAGNSSLLGSHAGRVINDNSSGNFGTWHPRNALEDWSREQRGKESDYRTPQKKKNPVLKPHPALVLIYADLQEAHCRPGNPTIAPSVQKVNENRDGDCRHPP